MARTNPVERRELEIGKRLAEARQDALVSQTALAVHIQIARERLVKYETGLVPLPFWPGLAACQALNINQCWLATGSGPFNPYMALDWKVRLPDVPKRALFSRVYDEKLKPLIEHDTLVAAALDEMRSGGVFNIDELFRSVTFAWLQNVPASQAGEFVLRLAKAAERILRDLKEKRVSPSEVARRAADFATAEQLINDFAKKKSVVRNVKK